MPASPNIFAYVVLIGWIPAAILLFRLFRPVTAATITIVGALVLLPADFGMDLPGFPSVDRHVVGSIAALAGYVLVVPRKLRNKQPLGWPVLLMGIQVLSAYLSITTNAEPLRYGSTTLPGLTAYDALGVAFDRLVTIGVPFYLGFRLVRSYEDVLAVLRVITIFGVAYVPLILWEVRMSPQLHNMIYGYYPRIFSASIRGSGFRPTVLTSSALEVGLFMATAATAAAALLKARVKLAGMRPILAFLLLLVGLFFSKSLGSILLGFLVPLLLLSTKASLQARVASFLSFVVLLYPLLRTQDLFPTQAFLSAAENVSHERAYSLEFRFENEDLLLKKARERLLFGWGTYARNRVYDPTSGIDESTPDGYWIVEMGMFGVMGFLSFFGLLLTPILTAAARIRSVPPDGRRALFAAFTLIVLVRAVDLIPNAFYAPLTMFLAGGLAHMARAVVRRTPSAPPLRASPSSGSSA